MQGTATGKSQRPAVNAARTTPMEEEEEFDDIPIDEMLSDPILRSDLEDVIKLEIFYQANLKIFGPTARRTIEAKDEWQRSKQDLIQPYIEQGSMSKQGSIAFATMMDDTSITHSP